MADRRRYRALRLGTALALTLASVALASQDQGRPAKLSRLLLAGTPGGLWRSADSGATWEHLYPGSVHVIAAGGSRWLVGGEFGLITSPDCGRTWTKTSLRTPVFALLLFGSPYIEPVMFAGTLDGLLRSDDGGQTFRPTALVDGPVRRIERRDPALLATSGDQVRASADEGRSFIPAGRGLPGGPITALTGSPTFGVEPVLLAGVAGGRPLDQGVFRSADGVQTWKSAGLVGEAVHDLQWIGLTLFGSAAVYAATDHGVYRTDDGGAHWKEMNEGISKRKALCLLFLGNEVFLGTDQGLYHSTDGGGRWQFKGLPDQQIEALTTASAPAPDASGP